MADVKRLATLILALLLTLALTPNDGAICAERLKKTSLVRIGIVSKSTLDLPFWVARERGFYRDEGLDAEIILMRSNLTLQAMTAGSIDFGTATGAAINAIVAGAELRVVLAMSDKPMFDLISQPSITSIQQLRGKTIGFGGIGSLSEVIMRRILAVNQIAPEQVNFINLGQNSLTYLAIKSGMIDATMLQVPQTFFAQDEGYRKLAATADFYRVAQGGLTTTKVMLSERPDTVTQVIRATLRAVRVLVNDKKYALQMMAGPYLELGNERDRFVERTYNAATQSYLASGVVEDKLQREMITLAAQRVKTAPPVPQERVFDFSFARKVGEALR
ncbi:MAG TPA: ABC transporter substrate-binding protein [Acidobacteriota bacterium]|nr:ABC transporter substrate-binding protein [Acidobacteriota bacterium]